MKSYNIKHYAHIGDAVWELFIRRLVIDKFNTLRGLHINTVKYVNATSQSEYLALIEPHLKNEENDIIKRAQNLPLSAQKRNNQNVHRHATAFEALIGFLYLTNKSRLDEIFEIIKQKAL